MPPGGVPGPAARRTDEHAPPVAARASATAAAAASTRPRLFLEDGGRGAVSLLDGVDTIVFDCDGVLWVGSATVKHAPEALRALRSSGKRLLFCTNNSSKSREQYVAKLAGLGIEAAASEIVSSSYAAAAYLAAVRLPPGKRALLLGPEGTAAELATAGVPFVTGKELGLPLYGSPDEMLAMELDPSIGAVVVAWDPHFNYSALVYASACLRELPGCIFVATNTDDFDHIGRGRTMPGTGCLVAALETATGVAAVNVGKGGPWLFPFLCDALQLDPSRTAVVGDRLDTDIAMARAGGMLAVLPLTGVATLEDALAAAPSAAPDAVIPSVAALAGL